jgi:hypothetical protein
MAFSLDGQAGWTLCLRKEEYAGNDARPNAIIDQPAARVLGRA